MNELDPGGGDDEAQGNGYVMDLSLGVACTGAHEDDDFREDATTLTAGTYMARGGEIPFPHPP